MRSTVVEMVLGIHLICFCISPKAVCPLLFQGTNIIYKEGQGDRGIKSASVVLELEVVRNPGLAVPGCLEYIFFACGQQHAQ